MKGLENDASSMKNELRAIRIFFIAIVIGAIAFCIASLFVSKVVELDAPQLRSFENGLLGFMCISCLAAYYYGKKVYNESLVPAKSSLITLKDKLNIYRSALLKFVALCEGAALFGIVLFIITSNYVLLAMAGIMIIVLLTKSPTDKRVFQDIELDWEERQQLT